MIMIMSLWIAAIAMLLFLGALSVRKVHRKIWCPIRGTEVQLSLLETAPEGRPLEVTACSAGSCRRPPSRATGDAWGCVTSCGQTLGACPSPKPRAAGKWLICWL
jgi:hypothetical protein